MSKREREAEDRLFEKWADSLERMLYWEQLRVNGMEQGADCLSRQTEVARLLDLWVDLRRRAGLKAHPATWVYTYVPHDMLPLNADWQ